MSRVQVVGISDQDAQFDQQKAFLGSWGEFHEAVGADAIAGFSAGSFKQDGDTRERFFLGVLVEEEIDE